MTPSSFVVCTASNGWQLVVSGGSKGMFFRNDTVSSLVFCTFNFMLLTDDHWVILSISYCKIDESIAVADMTSYIVQSSTYV